MRKEAIMYGVAGLLVGGLMSLSTIIGHKRAILTKVTALSLY